MKIALTGGSGGLGSAFAEYALSKGHTIVSIDRVAPRADQEHKGLRFVQADIAEYQQLISAFKGCDALVHMAAIPAPGNHPDHIIHNNNVVGSYNALRAAAECKITRICQASSVNAIGLAFSERPRFDYFPIDEDHPNYCDDPYSLSKWICEQQADSIVRRFEQTRIASLRFHWAVPDRNVAAGVFTAQSEQGFRQLWAYIRFDAAARACLLSLEADFDGHEAFYIVAPDTTVDLPSREMAAKYFPNVPIRSVFTGHQSFFCTNKARRVLGWKHDIESPPS